MFYSISNKWANRISKGRYNTPLIESHFGAMLRESTSVSIFRASNGNEFYKFIFIDESTLSVTLDRESVCSQCVESYVGEECGKVY